MDINMRLKLKIIEVFRSQTRFAYELGEDEGLVSRIVNGWRQLPPEKQQQWAKVLGCRIEDVFGNASH